MKESSKPERTDIKALVSARDRLLDIPDANLGGDSKAHMAQRASKAPSDGLLVLYPISKNSVPIGIQTKSTAREPLAAASHILGVGLVFPDSPKGLEDDPLEYDYVSVRLVDADPVEPDASELGALTEDTEGDASVALPTGGGA